MGVVRRVAIVGAGQAGGRVALELRARGFDGAITIFGEEPHAPYERPLLSKGVLTGADAAPVEVAPDWGTAGVALELGVRVAEIAPRRVVLAGGTVVEADVIVLATGGVVRTIEAEIEVLTLRTRADAAALRARAAGGGPALLVGAGVVGLEVATSLGALGVPVTVLEGGPRPLGRCLPDGPAQHLATLHRAAGVDLRCGAAVTALRRDGDGVVAHLADGAREPAAFVVAGIGMRPSTELASAARLRVEDGILVDRATQETSAPGVYAVGDCARAAGARRRETWAEANTSAARAAAAILSEAPPAPVPAWFWTDQAGVTVQVAGDWEAADTVVSRTVPGGRLDLHVRDGVLAAAIGIEAGRDMAVARRALGTRVAAPPLLAEPDVPLREALRKAAVALA